MCGAHPVKIRMARELAKLEAAGLPMRPAVGKPTQEYGKCTNLQILTTSFLISYLSDRASLPL
jgi:hypothetical protein